MLKHGILYEKDFLETIDEDARDMFEFMKYDYENEI